MRAYLFASVGGNSGTMLFSLITFILLLLLISIVIFYFRSRQSEKNQLNRIEQKLDQFEKEK